MKIMKLELMMKENIEEALEDGMNEYIVNTDGIGHTVAPS